MVVRQAAAPQQVSAYRGLWVKSTHPHLGFAFHYHIVVGKMILQHVNITGNSNCGGHKILLQCMHTQPSCITNGCFCVTTEELSVETETLSWPSKPRAWLFAKEMCWSLIPRKVSPCALFRGYDSSVRGKGGELIHQSTQLSQILSVLLFLWAPM